MSLVSLMNSMMIICCPKPHPELLKSLYLQPTKEYILSEQSIAGKRFPGNLKFAKERPMGLKRPDRRGFLKRRSGGRWFDLGVSRARARPDPSI